jgi:hypothetical protein
MGRAPTSSKDPPAGLRASRSSRALRVLAPGGGREAEDLVSGLQLLHVRVYLLEEVVEAHRHVETWQETGNVVLSLDA